MLVESKKKFIEFMIKCNVLKFGEFITKSGRKTPYFINLGNFSTGKQLKLLGSFYAEQMAKFKNEINSIFGPAYKGIAIAVCCSEALYEKFNLEVPFFFNRKEEKDHGEGGSFIGHKLKQSKENVAIVEDVLTAGTAIGQVVPQLKQNFNIEINHMFIAVDRCEKVKNSDRLARDDLKLKFEIEVHSIVNIFDIRNFIQSRIEFKDHLAKMDEYINSYCLN